MNRGIFCASEKLMMVIIFAITVLTVVFTLHPVKIRGFGSSSVAKTLMENIDNATVQIILNESAEGNFKKLYKANTNELFSPDEGIESAKYLGELYKKYLPATDKPCENQLQCGGCSKYPYRFFLEDGSCVGISTGASRTEVMTIFPGEIKPTPMRPKFGVVFYDINGTAQPNQLGHDQFLLPLSEDGIEFSN